MKLKTLLTRFKEFHYCIPFVIGGMEGPCPICGAEDGFQIRGWDVNGGGYFICRHCEMQGDANDLLRLLSDVVAVQPDEHVLVLKEIRCVHKGCGYVGPPRWVPQLNGVPSSMRLECPACGTFHSWAAKWKSEI